MYNISFFSYKGGSGRSSALVNTVPFLAGKLGADSEHPIILLDMDIDSTGLTYLLHQSDNVPGHLNVQKIMMEGIPGANRTTQHPEDHPFFKDLLKVGGEFGLENGAVLLLPAEPGAAVGQDGNMNLNNLNAGQVERIIDTCERHDCAAVIFDSSAGDQETATVSNRKADVIVCCMRPTIQFQEGTLDYFRRMNRVVRNRDVILLPNAVSRTEVAVDGKMFPISAKLRIADAFTEIFPDTGNTIHLDMLRGDRFGIPLVQRFQWQEAILRTLPEDRLAEDEKEALQMYEEVASLIVEYGRRGD